MTDGWQGVKQLTDLDYRGDDRQITGTMTDERQIMNRDSKVSDR